MELQPKQLTAHGLTLVDDWEKTYRERIEAGINPRTRKELADRRRDLWGFAEHLASQMWKLRHGGAHPRAALNILATPRA